MLLVSLMHAVGVCCFCGILVVFVFIPIPVGSIFIDYILILSGFEVLLIFYA